MKLSSAAQVRSNPQDGLLAAQPLTGGIEPMLGSTHLQVLSARLFPASTWPGLLIGSDQPGAAIFSAITLKRFQPAKNR